MAITQWESAYAIIGYDCRSKILNMTTISLVDIDDCELGEEKAEMFLPEIALLQLNEYEHTKIIQCKVEVNRVIQHCGWQSYNSIVNQGINEYIFPISREMCQVAHDHGTFRIGNTVFDGLMPNGETPDSKTQEVYPLLPRINTSTGPPTEIATTQRVFV
ncbi:Protein of unknown function [Cotesia congregata]|uniref:Uncharacterized protein n=1 Tax=Cotesia congregata TaxID=51543 RepID=A0A8J2HBG5_COTCN|nr:Protein of unknown function [Cotesia congregata]